MKPVSVFLLVTTILLACGPGNKPIADSVTALPDAEIPEGFTPLLSDNSLSGWRFFRNKPNNSWEISNGVLHCKPFRDDDLNERSDLITEAQYENFELMFQWKISHQGNSGIMFRVSEAFEEPFATGPEYQILDDEGYPGDVPAVRFSGGVFDMYAPENGRPNPVGEWNEGRIRVQGNQVEHWLNGGMVAAYTLKTEDWNARIANSKWKDFPHFASIPQGHIVLQDHGNEVWFRKMFIRILD
jgi:hypothetical protein